MKTEFDCICTFDGGERLFSHFADAAPEEVANYFTGHRFNVGNALSGKDDVQTCIKVEFIYRKEKSE